MSKEFKDNCELQRARIDELKASTKDMMDMVIEAGPENLGEARANIKLAYRHLEDARMRFGKAIQAADGGVSIYDKDKPEVANEVADKDT